MITQNIKIDLEGGLTGKEAVQRHLSILYGTRAGEQAQDRNFGIDWSFLDQPLEVAKAMLSAEIIEKTAIYEPTITVAAISFSADTNGNLTPTVRVEEAENE